jgi:hypothetical protein
VYKKPKFGKNFHVFDPKFFSKILKMTHTRVILGGKSIGRIPEFKNASQILIQENKCVYKSEKYKFTHLLS